MDVVLHYRSHPGSLLDLVDVAQKALEDFPCRVTPAFTPWFPSGSDRLFPLKPLKAPPVISRDDVELIKRNLQHMEPELAPDGGDIVQCLEKFSATTDWTGFLPCLPVVPKRMSLQMQHVEVVSDKKRMPLRCWSIFSRGSVFREDVQPFSKRFQTVVEHFRLHSLQRAKWVIAELNCIASDLEHVWTVVSRATRNSRLPTCHANIQRNLGEIWVFCDLLYCEYVGHFLKHEFNLTGQISLAVHKQGAIFRM